MKRPTILLVDDHALFRKGIIKALSDLTGEFTILEADNGKVALQICEERLIDLILLDIAMPVMDGYELLRHFKIRKIKIKIIAITLYNEPSFIYNLLHAGVQGYISKNSDPEILVEGIQAVLKGLIYYPKEFSATVQLIIQSGKISTVKISDRELQIIQLLAQGLTSKQIAGKLGYTERTVETKKLRLEKRLMAKSSAEVVSYAYKMGILKI